MADLTITSVRIIQAIDKFDAPADEAIAAATPAVRLASTGHVTKANGSAAGEAGFQGISATIVTRVGQAATVVRDGIVDLGDALDALAYGALVYLSNTDGTLADGAGTVSVIVGTVVPIWNGTTVNKVLRVRKGGV